MANSNRSSQTISKQAPRAGIYARCSTAIQNPQMQLREMREFARRRGFQVAGEYVDKGISGTRERRPELDRLMADARLRHIDVVIVYRYDRFARSLRHLVTGLDEFRSLGIDFISLHEGVDTSTANGRLIFGIFASIAEFEHSLICDRVRSGIENARRRGVKLGRPRTFVDRSEISKLRARGLSWRLIAKRMQVSVGTVFYRDMPARPIPRIVS
jgi:DNA invertase Pin-like site-specific DNA recombinase